MLGNIPAAEGLLGFFSDAPGNRSLLLARAKLHEAKGEFGKAAAALELAKRLSHERWREENEARLNSLQAKMI